MPSDFGAWLFNFGDCKGKTHLNNYVKCIMLSLLLISFPTLLYLVRTGVDERISIMWEETGVLREKPPGEASDRHTLSHTTNFDRGNRSNMCHSGEKRVHCPLRYSEPKSSFFNRFGMYCKFFSRLLQNVKTIFLSESNFIKFIKMHCGIYFLGFFLHVKFCVYLKF